MQKFSSLFEDGEVAAPAATGDAAEAPTNSTEDMATTGYGIRKIKKRFEERDEETEEE
jgi:hypothetical protein